MLNEPRGDAEPTPTASEQPRPGALTPPSSEVNFCANCGAGRPDAAAFCPTCGTAFRPTVATPAPPAVTMPTQTGWTPVQPTQPSGWVEPRPRNAPKLLQPVHLGADIGDLPRLVTRGYSVLVPGLILIVVFALFEATGANISNQSPRVLAFNLFIFPPSLLLPILAGVLTQRSSYLAGGIVGLLAGILFSAYVMSATFAPANGVSVTSDIRLENAFYALLVSPVAGVAMGSLGGFIQRVARIIVA